MTGCSDLLFQVQMHVPVLLEVRASSAREARIKATRVKLGGLLGEYESYSTSFPLFIGLKVIDEVQTAVGPSE